MENTYNKAFFFSFLRIFLKLLFLAVLILIFFWIGGEKIIENKIRQYIGTSKKLMEEVKMPAPSGPKTMTYEWEYNGQKYVLNEIFYDSFYNFYVALPKTYSYSEGELSPNWEEEYFNMFLTHPVEDKTITNLAAKIKELGIKNTLSSDQIVELALSFVQNIPYDEAKAKRILSDGQMNQSENTNDAPNYPYEVLYKKTGICSDKSFLAYSLIKELGYGAAIFVYESENHMAIGIKCPQNYSTYESGFCYAETTDPGNKIGLIPDLDSINNRASSSKQIEFFGDNGDSSSDLKTIGGAKIINISDGETYNGIVQTLAMKQKINELKIFLNKEREALKAAQAILLKNKNKAEDNKNKMDKLLAKNDYAGYNDLVPEYNKQVTNYQKDLKNYNNRINNYNQKVKEYNGLIKSFYQT